MTCSQDQEEFLPNEVTIVSKNISKKGIRLIIFSLLQSVVRSDITLPIYNVSS